jgi:spermidine/putrescine ABC transporter ATP-binding subunit
MAQVELKDIRASYGGVEAVKGVSLRLEATELVAVLGPSGCGKTTLIRVIAGFVDHEGTLLIDGRDMTRVPPHRRDIGIVFQDYALFPHQTVAENIGYGLRMRSRPRAEIRARVDELVDLLRLDGFAARYPASLSGGQRQRVAIARALACEPKVLLLDEPLSALDRKLREEMQVELREIQKRVGITMLFVTHDQEEALALADKVVVMKDGRVRQIGAPIDIYLRPGDDFVAEFIGKSTFFDATIVEAAADVAVARLADGETVRIPMRGAVPRQRITFAVRPERIGVSHRRDARDGMNALDAVVDHVVFLGSHQHVRARTAEAQRIEVLASNDATWRQGDAVTIEWHPKDSVVVRSSGISLQTSEHREEERA